MPLMVCHDDRVIETKFGHVFGFTKDVPLNVPPKLVQYVMERGAYPVQGQEAAVTAATTAEKPPVELTDEDQRKQVLVDAIKRLMDSGRIMMTAHGKPNPVQLGKEAKLSIGAEERDEAWVAYQTQVAGD